ncbi:integrase core domain-containing protein [Actinacidiphila glaucinigra]|uniref:integrase core domain-containing protein n=1 Tax=Actinacidiphila glaucinigra TaxID=235986 RepID=UPI0038654E5B
MAADDRRLGLPSVAEDAPAFEGGHAAWKTLSHVELATAEWIDWYNHRRLHGEIGHVPPVDYETNHYLEAAKPQVTAII